MNMRAKKGNTPFSKRNATQEAQDMSRKKDLAGMRFGKLTAVEPTNERKNGYTIWICKCDCGNTVRVPSRFLKNGWSSSCGCEEKKARFEDLTGKRFGKLLVLSKAEGHDEHGRILWNCVCDCGNTIVALLPDGGDRYLSTTLFED